MGQFLLLHDRGRHTLQSEDPFLISWNRREYSERGCKGEIRVRGLYSWEVDRVMYTRIYALRGTIEGFSPFSLVLSPALYSTYSWLWMRSALRVWTHQDSLQLVDTKGQARKLEYPGSTLPIPSTAEISQSKWLSGLGEFDRVRRLYWIK